ncbi:MAG TPA: META domain-containing protein [Roseiflexaceae bacterium]|nr:META domain-containing protein [Roseiflexaceae bacterium]
MDKRRLMLRGALTLLAALTLAACGRSDTGGQQNNQPGGQAPGGAEEWRAALAGAGAPLGAIPPEAALADTTWRLELLRGQPPVASSEVTLMFSDLQISGRACNYLMGSYALDEGGVFRGVSIGQTLMACTPNEVMHQEADFTQALREATRYRREGDRLTLLTTAGEELLVLQRAEPGEPSHAEQPPQTPEQELTASTWQQLAPGTYGPLPGGAALRFNGGQLELQVGCLRLTGPYETSGWRIRMLHQHNAEQLCAPGPDEPAQIRAFLERLGRTRFFWPSHGTLVLDTPDGKQLAFLAPREGAAMPAAAPLTPGGTLIDPTPAPQTPAPTSDLPSPTPLEPTATATPTPALDATPSVPPELATPTPFLENTPTPADAPGTTSGATPGLVQSPPGGPVSPGGAPGGSTPGSSGPSLPLVTTGPTPMPTATGTPAS